MKRFPIVAIAVVVGAALVLSTVGDFGSGDVQVHHADAVEANDEAQHADADGTGGAMRAADVGATAIAASHPDAADPRQASHRTDIAATADTVSGVAVASTSDRAPRTATAAATSGTTAPRIATATPSATAPLIAAATPDTARPNNRIATPTAPAIPCGDGTTAMFYGIVGHVQQGGVYGTRDYAQQVAQLRDLGMTLYAQDVSDRAGAEKVARLARVARMHCVGVLAALTMDLAKQHNETAAYRNGYTLGRDAARTLRGLVRYYQVGNEFDTVAIRGGHGDEPSDYDNGTFVKSRGAILGMIDGVKSVDPQAKIVLCALGWVHFGFSDMLHAGTQPDGTRGHRIAQWDITAWHWYSDMGDITFARGTNVLEHLKRAYRKPIWITEFGARPALDEHQAAAYLISLNALAGYVANAKKYDIQGVVMYELYDDQIYGGDGNYGVIMQDGVTRKLRYDIVKSFISTHAMP